MDKQEKILIKASKNLLDGLKKDFPFVLEIPGYSLSTNRWMWSESLWYFRKFIRCFLSGIFALSFEYTWVSLRNFIRFRRKYGLTSPIRYYEKQLVDITIKKIRLMNRYRRTKRKKYLSNLEKEIIDTAKCIDGIKRELKW